MIKFIVDDPKTRQALKIWASDALNRSVAESHTPEERRGSKVSTETPRRTLMDHLLGVFGSKIRPADFREERLGTSGLSLDMESEGFSPWDLPVYVLSNKKDTDGHSVPVEAKCTIDTSN